jgi:hypothetical protein
MSEHDFEPIRGLPGNLPAGERMLWQGAPNWWSLALRAYHLRSVALYFAALMLWRGAHAAFEGASFAAATQTGLAFAPLALAGLGVLAGLAWLTARTTVYTITTKRIVMRFGVALPKAINIPFSIIESAASKTNPDKTGDLAVTLTRPNKIAYLLLWPHARPVKLTRPEPTLRAIADAPAVAETLAAALRASQPVQESAHAPTGASAPAPAQPPATPQGALAPA